MMSEQKNVIKTDILTTLLRRALNDTGSRDAAMNAFINKASTLGVDTHLIEVYDGGLFDAPGKFANQNIQQWRERCHRVEGELATAKDTIDSLEKKLREARSKPSSRPNTPVIIPTPEPAPVSAEHMVAEEPTVSQKFPQGTRLEKSDNAFWKTPNGFMIWTRLIKEREAKTVQKMMIDIIAQEFGMQLRIGQVAGRLNSVKLKEYYNLSKKRNKQSKT